jgi:hypothetical protein
MANLDKDAVEREFVPCPTCKQYSHSIPDDKIAEAFRTFQSMFSHRNDGIPTQFCFDEKVRDAAQVLTALARQATEQVSDDAVLPCDVRLPPATTIAAGCKLGTLIHALECRGMATPAPNKAGQPSDDAVVERLRSLLAEAHPVPWELQDGSSWRRIGTKHGPCGNVLCPTKDHHDGHPDLTASDGRLYDNLTLIVEGINALPSLLDAIATMQSTDTEAVTDAMIEAGYVAAHRQIGAGVLTKTYLAMREAKLKERGQC